MHSVARQMMPPRGKRGPLVPTPAHTWFIARLLEDHAPCCLPLSQSEILSQLGRFRVIWDDGHLVAAVAARPLADGRMELRSLAVNDAWQGQGLARQLVSWVLSEADKTGRQVVCVTEKPGFFARMGFAEVPFDSVPDKPARRRYPSSRPRFAMAHPSTPSQETHP